MKHLKTICILLVFILIISHSLSAQQALGKDTLQSINALFQNWNDSTPGGTLKIMRGNNMIYNNTFGKADIENNIKNSEETVFEAGSVSKQFTAAAILLLVQEGKLSLDDDVNKLITKLPTYGSSIKVYHLLHHTSGIKDWAAIVNLSGWPRGTKAYTQSHVLDIIYRQKTLNFIPGLEYGYSNSNFILLTAIVEKVSGQKFTDFCRSQLFIPLGMTTTQWRDDFRKIVYNRSVAYSKSGKTYSMNMPFESNYGHGGLLTTVRDLIKWNEAWMTGKMGNNLSNLRLQKGVLNDGSKIDYAAGVFVKQYNGQMEVSHSGSTAGYRAWLAYYPERQLSIAYLSNDSGIDPEGLGEKLKRIFIGTSPSKKVIPLVQRNIEMEKWKEKVGAYKNVKRPEVIEIEMKDTGFFVKNGPQIQSISTDTFSVNGTPYVYSRDQIKVVSSGDLYKRMKSFTNSEIDLQVTGRYYSEDAAAEIFIEVKEGKINIFQPPGLRLNLQPVYKDAFFVFTPEKTLIEFKRDGKKKISGFDISFQRARNIPFKKIN